MQSEPVANEVATRRDTARTTREPAAPRNDLLSHLAAVGLGATAMYFLDPQRGRRRRHVMSDKFVHAAKEARGAVGSTSRDLQNRAEGLAAVARRLRRDRTDDEVLVERVRAALGRSVSHPGAIDVSAAQGRVTLRGQVLAGEADDLVASVARVRGTRDVVDDLERHELAGDVPALQGEGHLAESKFELMQENWTPAARLLAGVTGGAVAAMCLRSGQRRNALNA